MSAQEQQNKLPCSIYIGNEQMANKEIPVIFDTSAYRNFVYRRNYDIEKIQQDIFKLKMKEKRLNYCPRVSIVVLAELLKHLEDSSDCDYEACKYASAAAINHCRSNEGSIKSIVSYNGIVLAEAEKQGLLHVDSEVGQAISLSAKSMIFVSNQIEQNLSDEFISSKETHDAIKINVTNESLNRENFYNAFIGNLQIIDSLFDASAENVQAVLFKGKKKQSKEYREMLGGESFKKAAAISILSSEIRYELLTIEFVNYFIEKYHPVILLRKILYEKFEGMGRKPKNFWEKDMNTFNDIIIIMGALYVENSILVTKDAQIIKAYKDSGFEHRVMDFDEYEKEMLS